MSSEVIQALTALCQLSEPYRSAIVANSTLGDILVLLDTLCKSSYQVQTTDNSIYAIVGMAIPMVAGIGYLVYNKVSGKCNAGQQPQNPNP